MSVRARLAMALIVPTVRRAPWGTVAGCLLGSVATTWLVATRDTATAGQVITALRWAAVLLAAGIASVLDDPTEDELAGAGVPVWPRRLVALGVVGIPSVAGWFAALTIPDMPLPRATLTLEAAALVLLGTAVASLRRARAASVPAGVVAVAVPTVVLVAGPLLPASWALLVDPADAAGWHAAHDRWAGVAVGAAVAVAVTARDPGRRAPWRLLRPAAPSGAPSLTPSTSSPTTFVESP